MILCYTFAPESDARCIAVLKNSIIMKRILFVVAAFAAALVSCDKENASVPVPNTIIGGAEIAITLTDDATDTRAFFDTSAKAEA